MSASAPALERPLPHNFEAEQSVLGAILLDNSQLSAIAEKIKPKDFFSPRGASLSENGQLFQRMLAMHEAGQPIDLVTLCEELQRHKEYTGERAAYLASLIDTVPRTTNAAHYAAIVKEKAQLREVIHWTDRIQRTALEGLTKPEDLRSQVELCAASLVHTNGEREPHPVDGRLSYSLMDFLKAEFPVPEHLVEGLIPRGGTVLMFALPHRLKSWFTTALALEASVTGSVMAQLEVKKPVRTLLVQVEDFPGQLQWRMRQLLSTQMYSNCNPENVRIIPRCNLNLPDTVWYDRLLKELETFKGDHVIFDVVRRIFRGDVNSPKDTAAFLEQVDGLREATGCAVTLVHHSNKKDAEIMMGAAGSYNFPGWANVVVEFKRKTQEGAVTYVEIEVDNKLSLSPEPMRMVLDLGSQSPMRLEPLEDMLGIMEAQERLAADWTLRDLAEVLEVHRSSANRRLKKWLASGVVEKLTGGKRGRTGGLARYQFSGFNEK